MFEGKKIQKNLFPKRTKDFFYKNININSQSIRNALKLTMTGHSFQILREGNRKKFFGL